MNQITKLRQFIHIAKLISFFIIYFVDNRHQYDIVSFILSHHVTDLLAQISIPTSNDWLAQAHMHNVDPSI